VVLRTCKENLPSPLVYVPAWLFFKTTATPAKGIPAVSFTIPETSRELCAILNWHASIANMKTENACNLEHIQNKARCCLLTETDIPSVHLVEKVIINFK
jgi:hypothetical protein